MSYNAVNSLVNNWGMGIEDKIPDNWFNEVNKQEYNILEVGFGKGNLLKRFNSAGKNSKLYGIDASQQNYRYATTELKVNAQLSIVDISRERFQYPDGHFDVVILLEVLEHIMSPMACILEIKRVLKNDGLFIYSWPEERLISGIGKEEDQTKRQYGEGYHSFPYPGLFRYDNMRVFLNQMFFKVIEEDKKDYHIFWKMQNKKVDRPEILDVVNGDYNGLYNDIVTQPKFNLKDM
jgi:SAM-dependent methyltransferase